jgi:hypothetical protein
MTRSTLPTAALVVLLVSTASRGDEPPKATVVKLDQVQSVAPAEWKAEKPANRLRAYQFRLPRAGGDAMDAQVVVLPEATVKETHARVKAMFVPPEGKTVEDLAKVETLTLPGGKATVLDVVGTCRYKERPFDPKEKEQVYEDFRVVSVVLETAGVSFHVRFTGPKATVEKYKKGFDEWLRAFK